MPSMRDHIDAVAPLMEAISRRSLIRGAGAALAAAGAGKFAHDEYNYWDEFERNNHAPNAWHLIKFGDREKGVKIHYHTGDNRLDVEIFKDTWEIRESSGNDEVSFEDRLRRQAAINWAALENRKRIIPVQVTVGSFNQTLEFRGEWLNSIRCVSLGNPAPFVTAFLSSSRIRFAFPGGSEPAWTLPISSSAKSSLRRVLDPRSFPNERPQPHL